MNQTRNYGFMPLLLIGILFFIFGFITWANSQLIPYLEIACELSRTQSYYVATAFFAAYFVMSVPSSYVLKLTGFQKGMSTGLFVMAAGALLFIPAAQSRNYPLFLTGLFIIGSGLALLQTASNPYVTVLGPIESAARRISIMGICNKVAGIMAVYVLGSIMLKDADGLKARLAGMAAEQRVTELDALAARVITPYMLIAGALLLLGIVFLFIHLPEITDTDNTDESTVAADKNDSIFRHVHLLLGALAIFFYVGVEVISYDTFTAYGEYMGYPLAMAKSFASYTGYGLLLGYITGIIAIPRYISQRKALIYSVLLSMVLVVVAMTVKAGLGETVSLLGGKIQLPANIGIWCFAFLGFSNSVMWPAIWPLALDGIGKYTKIGGALLVMCIVGGAVLPPLYGKVAAQTGSAQLAYWIMLPCYAFILYFALSGYKQDRS